MNFTSRSIRTVTERHKIKTPVNYTVRLAFANCSRRTSRGSNDRDICARHLFILPQEYTRDSYTRHPRPDTWNRSLVYEAERGRLFSLRRRTVAGWVLPDAVRWEPKYPRGGRVSRYGSWYENLILASSRLALEGLTQCLTRVSSREFNSLRWSSVMETWRRLPNWSGAYWT